MEESTICGQMYRHSQFHLKRELMRSFWIPQNQIRLIGGDTVIRREDAYGPYFSIFPLGQEIYSLSIEGAKYPLHDHQLTPYDSLCVSNQFEEDEVKITFGSGIVILMETRDKK